MADRSWSVGASELGVFITSTDDDATTAYPRMSPNWARELAHELLVAAGRAEEADADRMTPGLRVVVRTEDDGPELVAYTVVREHGGPLDWLPAVRLGHDDGAGALITPTAATFTVTYTAVELDAGDAAYWRAFASLHELGA